MSTVQGGPGNIIKNGLVLNLDAANPKSFLPPPFNTNTWNDISGNGYNGTLTNGPTYSSSNFGNILFDGSDDTVIGSCTTVNANNGMSSLIWAKTSISSPQVLFGHDSDANNGFRLEIDGGAFMLTFGGVANYSSLISISDGNWKFLSVTTTSTTGRIYINGSLVASPVIGTMQGAPNKFRIGGGLSTRFLNGNVASTFLYNRVLSQTEILQNFNATRARFGV